MWMKSDEYTFAFGVVGFIHQLIQNDSVTSMHTIKCAYGHYRILKPGQLFYICMNLHGGAKMNYCKANSKSAF
jgi:hypothetical protein